jgi:hypothetical protein
MKICEVKYETMRAALILAIEQGGGTDHIRTEYKGLSRTRMLFDVWHVALRSLPGFDMYSDGDNDDHIETALRKIGREAGLCPS